MRVVGARTWQRAGDIFDIIQMVEFNGQLFSFDVDVCLFVGIFGNIKFSNSRRLVLILKLFNIIKESVPFIL